MEHVKVKLIRDWGKNGYYKAGNIVYVSADVAKMMTTGRDNYGFLIDNDDNKILDDHFASGEEE